MDWGDDLTGDLGVEYRHDAATEIENQYRHVLEQDFDSDVPRLQAYLHQVAKLGALPPLPVQHWVEEDVYEGMEAFAELIDTYPLDPEILKDDDGVYRRSMVRFCSELLKAKIALKTGQAEKTWWHLSRVSFYDGQAQGYYQGVKPAEDKKRSGRAGGIAKEVNAQLIARNACIQHLESDCPKGGWRSPQAAVDVVAPKVENMMRKQGKEIDVCALLYVWLNGDPDVQKAGGLRMQCIKR
ncbi:hypothetical protein Q3O98_16685 [Ralstonia pseudosolanacearum]|uniref:hypothetical protein n=1 Tax=Ralstonia pseudosolanacearum TaxID=1310165 RepID=UPI002675698A|nr:hypothetical protein [Ralstonia pseudosolanacearum]MDO3622723.1 hypothetical protein [Ralstonia pseudosolanacearum]